MRKQRKYWCSCSNPMPRSRSWSKTTAGDLTLRAPAAAQGSEMWGCAPICWRAHSISDPTTEWARRLPSNAPYRLRLYQPVFHRQFDGRCQVFDLKLFHQVLAVAFYGMRTDKQYRGDLLRGQSFGRLVEDLFFPAGDLGYALQPLRGFPLHDFGRLRTQEAPAVDDGTDAVDDFLPHRIFLNIAVGAFLKHAIDYRVFIMHAERDDPRGR